MGRLGSTGDSDVIRATLCGYSPVLWSVIVTKAKMRLFRSSNCPLVLTLILLATTTVNSRPQPSVQSQLNPAYKDKTLLLRGFYSGKELEYDQDGLPLGAPTRGPWTLASVKILSVTIAAPGIEITGERLGTLFGKGKPQFVKIGKLRIHVAKSISDIDTMDTLRPIFGKIFFEPGEEIGPELPEYWRPYVTGKSQPPSEEHRTPTVKAGEPNTGHVTAPRVVYDTDPKYSKEAASHHIEGPSLLRTVIDARGIPGDIVIVQPLGMGLDEQAVLALQSWKFEPSRKDGQPVAVPINVQMNFRCCP